ncbi:MAG: nuclear transport factor 2 family protein [Solirubrobacteraceae bacterium]|nr:nuclear transport factor 2 family protein [Solirubrobacteraceae bacterium]
MADRQAILDLLSDYAWANDTADVPLLGELFATDATMRITIAGVDEPFGPYVGRDAIVEWMGGAWKAQTDQRRHVITNHRFENEQDDRADVRAYLSLHVTDGGKLQVTSAGVYRTTVVRDGDRWRIAALDLALDAPF